MFGLEWDSDLMGRCPGNIVMNGNRVLVQIMIIGDNYVTAALVMIDKIHFELVSIETRK